MTKPQIIIGCDPDSQANGIAIYRNGKLEKLACMTSVEIVDMINRSALQPDEFLFSIENVCANNTVYAKNRQANKEAQSKVAMCVGRNQHAQIEVMRWLDALQIKYVLHRPQTGNWKDKRVLFEKITGWKARSNADTRSAAYFGYLEARKITC